MARKRPAPPPPPPPPPQEEDESSSGEEDEDEEEAPPTPAPRKPPQNPPPPPAAAETDESEDDDEESESESESDNPQSTPARPAASASPRKPPQPPPPSSKPPPESDTDDDEDERDSSEPEPGNPEPAKKPEKAAAAKPAALALAAKKPKAEPEKKRPRPENSPSSKAKKPRADPEKKTPEPSSASKAEKHSRFQRVWSAADEIKILEALAAHVEGRGVLPKPDELIAAVRDQLDKKECNRTEMYEKVRRLKLRYEKAAKKVSSTGVLPSKDDDLLVYKLSQTIWGETVRNATEAQNGGTSVESKEEPVESKKRRPDKEEKEDDVNGPSARRCFDELQVLYPNLAEVVEGLNGQHAGGAMLKSAFEFIGDEKAHALDAKIKKQRVAEMKMEFRQADIKKEVFNTLIGLID